MDSFWQQHRTFVLKIAGGLVVVLVCWIIGSSFTDESLDEMAARNDATRMSIARMKVPDPADTAAFKASVDKLEARVQSVAAKVGKVVTAQEFRGEIIRDILELVGKGSPANVAKYSSTARSSPLSVAVQLQSDAREFLNRKAGLANVLLVSDFGSLASLDESQVDRYLIGLELAIRIVNLAIEEGLYEVKDLDIDTLAGGRFAEADEFIRDFPVTVVVRGQAAAIVGFFERMNDPADFIPVAELRVAADKNERDPSVQTARLRVSALRIDLGTGE